MAIKKDKVDAVLVGFGWTGAILGQELTEAGLHVLALERGVMQDTPKDAEYPKVIDELCSFRCAASCSRISPRKP